MTPEEQIDKAIGRHGMWKSELRTAIDTGQSTFDPKVVRMDNQCEFGKWLLQDIDHDMKKSETYKTIVGYHADFHKEAARILEMALNGDRVQAEEEMNLGSKFSAMSAALTTSMVEWKKML
ncbi:CZB domain-containing protein [Patescibacteria group bacterium]|nr:CZB domain-containing protein [Patescibacteria group bacterium]